MTSLTSADVVLADNVSVLTGFVDLSVGESGQASSPVAIIVNNDTPGAVIPCVPVPRGALGNVDLRDAHAPGVLSLHVGETRQLGEVDDHILSGGRCTVGFRHVEGDGRAGEA